MGTKLNFSSAHHLQQTDGQSEIANSRILDLLKFYVTRVIQKTQWERCLILVEHAYSNTIHNCTSKTLFKIIKGCPNIPLFFGTHESTFVANEYVH